MWFRKLQGSGGWLWTWFPQFSLEWRWRSSLHLSGMVMHCPFSCPWQRAFISFLGNWPHSGPVRAVTAVSRPLAPGRALLLGWTVRLGLTVMELCCRKARGHVVTCRIESGKSKNSIFVFFFFFLNKDLLCEVSRFVFLFVFFPLINGIGLSFMWMCQRWRLLIENNQGNRGCRLVPHRSLIPGHRFLFCRFYYPSAAPLSSGKGFLPFL